jgi:hypothetical protein
MGMGTLNRPTPGGPPRPAPPSESHDSARTLKDCIDLITL